MPIPSSRCLFLTAVVAVLAAMSGCGGIQVSYAGRPVSRPAPSAATTQPAPVAQPVVKDVGMFGNFEIGPGFGAQRASGYAGVVAGVTDGNINRDSLRFLGDVYSDRLGGMGTDIPYDHYYARTTMEGEKYNINTIGNCYEEYLDFYHDTGRKPSHKLTVTAPVGVRFDFKGGTHRNATWMLFGQDIRVCENSEETNFTLELLPGEYEIYTGNYEPDGQNPYTVTLTEQQNLITQREITLQPGFGEVRASGVMLSRFYRQSPMAQPHELTVTAPMTIELLAENNDERLLGITLIGQNLHVEADSDFGKGMDRLVVPLEPGQYQVFVELTRSDSPGPYALTIQENTTFKPRHLSIGQGFSPTRMRGGWVKNNTRGQWNDGIPSAPHRLTVTFPQMVSIKVGTISSNNEDVIRDSNYHDAKYHPGYFNAYKEGGGLSPYLRRISPEEAIYSDSTYQRGIIGMDVFLAPGEYELYIQGDDHLRHPYLYDVFIEPPQ